MKTEHPVAPPRTPGQRPAVNTDFEVASLDAGRRDPLPRTRPWWHQLKYLLAGTAFGVVLVKSEVVSWFRIQEMFRLQSFHLFGIMGSAIAVGMLSVWLIRKFNVKTLDGEPIVLGKKSFHRGQVYGGLLFGCGWAMTGACPGPLFAQIGAGAAVVTVTLLGALVGTWVYGFLRDRLPH
jgi:uncharacterized membrane protein YedE/YeeE